MKTNIIVDGLASRRAFSYAWENISYFPCNNGSHYKGKEEEND